MGPEIYIKARVDMLPRINCKDIRAYKIKEAEQILKQLKEPINNVKKTGSLLREHLYHTKLHCSMP